MPRSEAHIARNRAFREGLNDPEASKAALAPTAEVVKNTCAELHLPVTVEDIPNGQGAKLHLIGDTSARKAVLYFHGGGYGIPPFPGHIKFWAQTQGQLAEKGSKVVIAFLEYGLTPNQKFPIQFIQATEALRHLFSKGYQPSDIVVGGDSAGGNLAVGLASVLNHPLPGTEPLKISEPLAGLLLISPWVSFESSAASFAANDQHDIFSKEGMQTLAKAFVTDSERNEWSEPIRAKASWWQNTPVKKVLNVYGELEVFRDDDKVFGEVLKEGGLNVKSVECPEQVHVDCVLDAETGLETGAMSTEIWSWLETVF